MTTVDARVDVDAYSAQRGEQFRVSLEVSNLSLTTQNQIVVAARLPNGIDPIQSAQMPTSAECTRLLCGGGETISWTIDSLGPRQSTGTDLWFEPTIANAALDGDILLFEAQVMVGNVPRAVAGATVAVEGP